MFITALWPKAWNSGRAVSITSSSARANSRSATNAFITMLRWVSSAPLGRPVVPLV